MLQDGSVTLPALSRIRFRLCDLCVLWCARQSLVDLM